MAAQHGQAWATVEHLHRIRGLLMELYARTHGGGRALPIFQAQAPAELQARLGRLLPGYGVSELRGALENCSRS